MKNEGIKIHVYRERDGGGDIHAYTCVYTFKRHMPKGIFTF